MIPALAFATPTEILDIYTELFMEMPPEAYASSIAIPSMFPIEMWNNHHLVHHVSNEPLTQQRLGIEDLII